MSEQIINKVESLKMLLISHATGGSADDPEYRQLRGELISSSIGKRLPRFVNVCRNLSEFWSFIQPKFSTYAGRRGYLREEFDPILTFLEEAQTPSDVSTSAIVKSVDSSYVHEAWQKALDRRTADPEGAVTASRTLLEAVCKHILDERNKDYDDNIDLPKLYASVAGQLNLSPSQHSEQIFKQILGGCQAVVSGIGALRNRHSDAHGKGSSGVRPASRHAELAVNLAGTMATFLLQTHLHKIKKTESK